MSLTIPQIRNRLYELAVELRCPELARLAGETYRRRPIRKAPAKTIRITERVCECVRGMARDYPSMPYRDIGRFNGGIDGGRVSEILHGYRDGSPFIPEPNE